MPQIRPITDLRNTHQISETAMIDTAISEAETELEQNGQLFDAKDALASLRRKHFG